jgi:hypothetical protein
MNMDPRNYNMGYPKPDCAHDVKAASIPMPTPQPAATTLIELIAGVDVAANSAWALVDRLEMVVRRLQGPAPEQLAEASSIGDGLLGVLDANIIRGRNGVTKAHLLVDILDKHI